MVRKKVKLGFFGMTSCKGCYFQFLLLGEKLLDLFENVDIRHFWVLKEDNVYEKFDVAFMDGAVSCSDNAEEVKRLRKNSRFLIAFGTCACLGGIPALRNEKKDYHKAVYGGPIKHRPGNEVTGIGDQVKVDYYMYGCPINEREALDVIRDLLMGKNPREPDYPVCVDCKKAGTRCLFKDGVPCMGPVTNAGCGAPCPASRSPCDGCRGPLPDANWSEESRMLGEHGITKEMLNQMFSKYAGNYRKEETSFR